VEKARITYSRFVLWRREREGGDQVRMSEKERVYVFSKRFIKQLSGICSKTNGFAEVQGQLAERREINTGSIPKRSPTWNVLAFSDQFQITPKGHL
jgi:hypothetical protein